MKNLRKQILTGSVLTLIAPPLGIIYFIGIKSANKFFNNGDFNYEAEPNLCGKITFATDLDIEYSIYKLSKGKRVGPILKEFLD